MQSERRTQEVTARIRPAHLLGATELCPYIAFVPQNTYSLTASLFFTAEQWLAVVLNEEDGARTNGYAFDLVGAQAYRTAQRRENSGVLS